MSKRLRHEGKVTVAKLSPYGQYVLTVGEDKTMRLWQATTGKPIGLPLRHQAEIHDVAFSPDGRLIVTGGEDRSRMGLEGAALGGVSDPPARSSSSAFHRDPREHCFQPSDTNTNLSFQ